MTHSHAYTELAHRLAALDSRIDHIKTAMANESDREKVQDAAKLADLEHRHKVLADRLAGLKDEGFGGSLRAELSLMLDDLTTAIDDVVSWVESAAPTKRS